MVTPRSESLLLRDTPRSPSLGVVVAIAAVAATTLVIYPLGAIAPAVSLGVVYLLAVLLISTSWGLWLGLLTAVLSALTFNWFHIPPTGRFHVAESQNWVALGVFLAATVIASTVAGVARARAREAQRRREEADLAAAMAGTLLGTASVGEALGRAAQQLAGALGLRFAEIRTEPGDPGDGADSFPLRLGGSRAGVLLVPADLDEGVAARLTRRVVPSLEALLGATLDRERLQREVMETQALRRSDVMKTALLRAVSHDLRSPLTAIIAAGDAVRSPTIGAQERDELASMITGEAARLSRLVEQLLDLSRLQAGAAEPRRDWCSVEEIVGTAIEHLGDAQCVVRVTVADEPLPLIAADAAQLERVFVNLLENACRFSDSRPVDVGLREVNGRVAIRVMDRGSGIPDELRSEVFEPFRRGEDDREHVGSGLGLAIVKGLVEANGGRVSVESRPGDGTIFSVELPVTDTAAHPAPAARVP